MDNLEKKKTNDISIAINGEAFISRNKCAELLDLNQSTVLHWVSANAYLNSVNNNNQLNEDLFQNLVKTHRLEGNKNANALTDLFIELGVRAYLYSIAGIANAPDRTPIEKFDPDLAEDKNDFTVNTEGKAFISTRKVSELTGVSRVTLAGWVEWDTPTNTDDENNQLDAKRLLKVVLRARDNNYPLSADLLNKILEAGVTAFIYRNAKCATPEQRTIEKLESDLAKEKKKVQSETGTTDDGSQINKRFTHEEREQLFTDGMCDRITVESTRYYYPVSELGLLKGYTNIGTGVDKTINLEK